MSRVEFVGWQVLDEGAWLMNTYGNLNATGLPDGRIAVLYEGGSRQIFRETIYFATCTISWLTAGRDHGEPMGDAVDRGSN